jgi:hypothetical protein
LVFEKLKNESVRFLISSLSIRMFALSSAVKNVVCEKTCRGSRIKASLTRVCLNCMGIGLGF